MIIKIKNREQAPLITSSAKDLSEFLQILPFRLTDDQNQVIRKITQDISNSTPMNRLLQGEVGSGKTIVAASILFLAVKNKFQSAFLVPTEILAEQHYRTLRKMFDPLNIFCTLLTGGLEDVQKRKALERPQNTPLRRS